MQPIAKTAAVVPDLICCLLDLPCRLWRSILLKSSQILSLIEGVNTTFTREEAVFLCTDTFRCSRLDSLGELVGPVLIDNAPQTTEAAL
jgi:hypothetical protein